MSNQQQLLAFLGANVKTTHTINTYFVANSWFGVACTLKISQMNEALIRQIKPWLVHAQVWIWIKNRTCRESWRQRCIIPVCSASSPVSHCFPLTPPFFVCPQLFLARESTFILWHHARFSAFSAAKQLSAVQAQHWFCLHWDQGETWKAYRWILDFTTEDKHTHTVHAHFFSLDGYSTVRPGSECDGGLTDCWSTFHSQSVSNTVCYYFLIYISPPTGPLLC